MTHMEGEGQIHSKFLNEFFSPKTPGALVFPELCDIEFVSF